MVTQGLGDEQGCWSCWLMKECSEKDVNSQAKDAFVDSKTSYADVGGVRIVDANGTCLSCDSEAVACRSTVDKFASSRGSKLRLSYPFVAFVFVLDKAIDC